MPVNKRPSRSKDFEPKRKPRHSAGKSAPSRKSDDRKSEKRGERSYESYSTSKNKNPSAKRSERSAKRSERFESERPKRRFDSEKPAKRYESEKPAKRYSAEKPTRRYESERPARTYESEKPAGKRRAPDVKLDKFVSEAAQGIQTFQEMDLPERLVMELAKGGIATPFPIQAATIPAALSGRDVLGRGKTGSGKTVAFGVPLITFLARAGNQPRIPNKPRALVLAPTRELAEQIDKALAPIAKSVGFFTTTIYGGVPQSKQERVLNRGVDIAIATPGRLEDLMEQGVVDLSEVERVVIDEADHMAELGFIEPVTRILTATGQSQKLLFSATLDKQVSSLVKKFLTDPFVYEVPGETEQNLDIEHRVLITEPRYRSRVFHRLVQGSGKSIVFVRTKQTAEALAQSLNDAGIPTARLHGDLNQSQRTRNLARFSEGFTRVLIATDVAARGIHVDDVKLVIQVDLPEDYKTYLHRAGRTGRAGRKGIVVSIVPAGKTRKIEGILERSERKAIYSEVVGEDPLLAELAGPIAPPPVLDQLDFGDSRFDGPAKRSGKPKSGLRDGKRPNKLQGAKDRRFRSR
jgi:superfamily II DNA/RNA helicase